MKMKYKMILGCQRLLVELRGIEPLTLCMPCKCATICATAPLKIFCSLKSIITKYTMALRKFIIAITRLLENE